jgi:hypothetical protein
MHPLEFETTAAADDDRTINIDDDVAIHEQVAAKGFNTDNRPSTTAEPCNIRALTDEGWLL